jgi:hypothetical protein
MSVQMKNPAGLEAGAPHPAPAKTRVGDWPLPLLSPPSSPATAPKTHRPVPQDARHDVAADAPAHAKGRAARPPR